MLTTPDTKPGHPPVVQHGPIGTREAPHRITIEHVHTTRGSATTTGRAIYAVWFRGEVIVSRWEAEYSACRELLARGFTGRLETWRPGATAPGLTLDIAQGALLAVQEGDRHGPRNAKFNPFKRPEDIDVEES